ISVKEAGTTVVPTMLWT
nr:immunoglobulin heavy chain junction region [Mus musculus]